MHRMLKYLASGIFLMVSFLSLSAQTGNDPFSPDPRLLQVIEPTQLAQLQKDKPELILYYNYLLDHCYYVVQLNAVKPVTGTDIHTVSLKGSPAKFSEKTFRQSDFNVMKYDFSRDLDRYTTYVWKEAGVALVFHPLRHFQASFADYSKAVQSSR
jgi:hypothetical protein